MQIFRDENRVIEYLQGYTALTPQDILNKIDTLFI